MLWKNMGILCNIKCDKIIRLSYENLCLTYVLALIKWTIIMLYI